MCLLLTEDFKKSILQLKKSLYKDITYFFPCILTAVDNYFVSQDVLEQNCKFLKLKMLATCAHTCFLRKYDT